MSDRLRTLLTITLALTGVYLYGFPSATLPYAVAIVAHVVLGVGLLALLLPMAIRLFAGQPAARAAWLAGAGGGRRIGVVLIKTGGTLPYHRVVIAHFAVSALGGAILLAAWLGRRGILAGNAALAGVRWALVAALVAATAVGATYTRVNLWKNAYRITNPAMPPQAMQVEGLGQAGPFFPSSVRTPDGRTIKSSLLHGLAGLRALPQGHLPPVVRLGAPLLVVQQPVVPQEHRVHAGRGRRAAVEVVRRLPRSGDSVQRPDGHAHPQRS